MNSIRRKKKNTHHQNFFPFVCYRYIIVVEHDLSVLDYLSDFICCLYGVPSAYGVVTMPFSVREGALQTDSDHVTASQSTFTIFDSV